MKTSVLIVRKERKKERKKEWKKERKKEQVSARKLHYRLLEGIGRNEKRNQSGEKAKHGILTEKYTKKQIDR